LTYVVNVRALKKTAALVEEETLNAAKPLMEAIGVFKIRAPPGDSFSPLLPLRVYLARMAFPRALFKEILPQPTH
jgi:hypothetical protein